MTLDLGPGTVISTVYPASLPDWSLSWESNRLTIQPHGVGLTARVFRIA